MSFKLKLSLLLVSICGLAVGAFAWLAISDFSNDKIAYVVDSVGSIANSLSGQASQEILQSQSDLAFILSGATSSGLSQNGELLFSNHRGLRSLSLLAKKGQQWNSILSREKPDLSSEEREIAKNAADSFAAKELSEDFFVKAAPGTIDSWVLGFQFKLKGQEEIVRVVALIKGGRFLQSLEGQSRLNISLFDRNQKSILGKVEDAELNEKLISEVSSLSTSSKTTQLKVARDILLTAITRIDGTPLTLVAWQSQEAALQAIAELKYKLLFFAVALFLLTLSVSIFSARGITQNLTKLVDATVNISKGDFSSRADIRSNDELGILAKSFNVMSDKIKVLLKETEEKGRMESELRTAQTVQKMLLPERTIEDKDFKVTGYYQSASECGGDWMYYFRRNDLLYIWIGDVTGHGVSAALVTSAVRSAVFILEKAGIRSSAKMIDELNKAVFVCSKEIVMMTMFHAILDLKTLELNYCNASHDPVYILRKKSTQYEMSEIKPLMGNLGARLGEAFDSEFTDSQMKLEPGDFLFAYTDGLPDLQKFSGGTLGDRAVIRALIASLNKSADTEEICTNFFQTVSNDCQVKDLKDDVTFLLAHIKS